MNGKIFLVLPLFVVGVFLAGCSAPNNDLSQQQESSTAKKEITGTDSTQKEPMKNKAGDQAEEMAKGYVDISVQDAKKMIDKDLDLIVVDVSPLYAKGHLPGAVNYYVGDGSLDEAIPSLDKEATYLVYCHNDSASILGAQKLVDAGFKNVYRLEGNFGAWTAAGYPIEK